MARQKQIKSSELNKRIASLIKARGISVAEVARRSEIRLSTLHQWTTDTTPTDFPAVQRLARVLDVSFSFLLTGEDDKVSAMSPGIEDVFKDGGDVFNGYLEVQIKRLLPKK